MDLTQIVSRFFKRTPPFWVVATISIGLYALLAIFYATPGWSSSRLNRELMMWPIVLGLLGSYWFGYQALLRALSSDSATASRGIAKSVLVSGVCMALLAVWVSPFHSTDLFGYINRGWQQLHYHLNPYVYTVDHIPQWESDPMITDHWINNPSPYGFLFLLIAKGLCWLGQGDKTFTVLVFKSWNLVIHLATALLIWLGIRQQALKPKEGLAALYLYLWNPLVLIHGLANGHNDILMGFFLTLSAYFALAGAWLWILPSLMAATLIKYGAVVVIPFALLWLYRQKTSATQLLAGSLPALAVFVATGWPYLPDWQSFHLKEISRNALVSHGSIHSVIYSLFKTATTSIAPQLHPYREWVRNLLKNILISGYAFFYGRLLWTRFRQAQSYTASLWITDAVALMAVLICLISLKFYPWYIGMFFPLALLLPSGHWLRRFVIVLSCAQLLSITFIGQAHFLNFALMTGLPIGWMVGEWRRNRPTQNLKPMLGDFQPS